MESKQYIHSLYLRNVQRIAEINFEPPPDGLISIGGQNAAGKTSLMLGIFGALGGKVPDLRDGQEQGEIKLELTDYSVTLHLSEKSNSIELRNKTGNKLSSPKTTLKELFGKRAFDVPDFLQATPAKQVEALLNVIEIPGSQAEVEKICGDHVALAPQLPIVDAIKTAHSEMNAARNVLERKISGLQQTIGPLPTAQEIAEIDLAELYEMKEQARQRNALEEKAAAARGKIDDLKEQLNEAQRNLAEIVLELDETKPYKVIEIDMEIENAKLHNERAALAREHAKQADYLREMTAESNCIKNAIAALKTYKNDIMTRTRFPVDGLNIRAGKVYYQNRELKKASGAEQILVAVSIAAAEIPPEGIQCLFILDPPQLDESSWAALAEFAAERQIQLWIAKVCEAAGDTSIFLREGKREGKPE